MSAVKTGDLATAEKMEATARGQGGRAAAASGRRRRRACRSRRGAAAPVAGGGPDAANRCASCTASWPALIALAKGQKDRAVALLKEAVQIEESMRPPNGAADPVKPSHELLGEVLLQSASRPKRRRRSTPACCACRTARAR